MAQPITDEAIRRLPVVPYKELRRELRSGDLLFTSGEYPISRLIRRFTDSPWSHVGIVFRVEVIDRVLLLESVESVGVRFAPLSKYLTDYAGGKPYAGCAVIARCEGIGERAVERIAAYGTDQLTRSYDREEIVAIAARIALGGGKRSADEAYICSELVYECFARAGCEFAYDRRGFVSPENLWRDPRVALLSRIL